MAKSNNKRIFILDNVGRLLIFTAKKRKSTMPCKFFAKKVLLWVLFLICTPSYRHIQRGKTRLSGPIFLTRGKREAMGRWSAGAPSNTTPLPVSAPTACRGGLSV